MSQTELIDTVRKTFEAAQAVAATRLEGLEGDARKVVSELVEKGRHSQRNIAERLQRLAESQLLRQRVRPVEDALKKLPITDLRSTVEKAVDDLSKRVSELQNNTREFVEGASREQLLVVIRELRRVADLLSGLVEEEGAEKSAKPAAKAKAASPKAKESKKAKTESKTETKKASAKTKSAAPAKKAAAKKPAAKKAATSAKKESKNSAPKAKKASGTKTAAKSAPKATAQKAESKEEKKTEGNSVSAE